MGLDESVSNGVSTKELGKRKSDYKWNFVWKNILSFIYIHLSGLYGVYLMLFYVKYLTLVWCTYFISSSYFMMLTFTRRKAHIACA